jgi:hypothetical protein
MATEKSRKQENPAPPREGEFSRILGIAEATEKRLHAAGIQTFSQLADSTPEGLAELLPGQVGVKERILRQDWLGQAHRYAELLAGVQGNAAERQYYQSFMVELLLDEQQAVRRTRIAHVQSGTKDGWAGWQPARLNQWIEEQGGLIQAGSAQPEPSARAAEPVHAAQQPGNGKSTVPALSGDLYSGSLQLFHTGGEAPVRTIHAGAPFEIHLALDLSGAHTPADTPLAFQADVFTRPMGGQRIRAGQATGKLPASDHAQLSLPVAGIARPGMYRLEILTLVFPEGADRPEQSGLWSMSEGLIIQIA